jgi:multisubunit Na+/H+ antiporter MnhF subunit
MMFLEIISVYMNPKYLALYLIAGTLALLLTIYQVIKTYPAFNDGVIALNLVMCIFFYYLAFKTYHEKKDEELM